MVPNKPVMCTKYVDVPSQKERLVCGLTRDEPAGNPAVRTHMHFFDPETDIWFRATTDYATNREKWYQAFTFPKA